jgi:hypothetical protein
MIFKFIPIALVSLGALGMSAYGTSQAPQYGGNQAQEYGNNQAQGYGGNEAPNYNAAPEQPGSANPGAVNYVEGSVLLNGNPLNRRDVGLAYLQTGDVLSTQTGRAEILLTPGVFLRLDNNSAVKMVSPDLTKTQVEVEQGRAAVEVDQIFPQNDLEVLDAGVATQMLKPGFYEFNAGQPAALVFEGKAVIRENNGRTVDIKEHHEVRLVANAEEKSSRFDTHNAEDGFYRWSSLRSEYLAEANNQIAGQYAGVNGFAPGWYWDPWMWDYTFVGLGPYWSPFGFGFYPPWGWYGGYWRGGYYGGRYYGGGFRGGFVGGYEGGFHGGEAGGFHGGGGGGHR